MYNIYNIKLISLSHYFARELLNGAEFNNYKTKQKTNKKLFSEVSCCFEYKLNVIRIFFVLFIQWV